MKRKSTSSRTSFIIAVVFHVILISAVFFFAAHEGVLGKKLQQIAVTMVKEKKQEVAREKPPEPKIETPKTENKIVDIPKPVEQLVHNEIPPVAPPVVVPPSISIPTIDFSDGAKEVMTTTDKNILYKGQIEYVLRTHWNKPEGINDKDFVVEVELNIDSMGKVGNYKIIKESGNKKWDDSVNQALAKIHTIGRSPPKGFPETFLVRFDVEMVANKSL
jgi:hypothetical protein